MGFLAPLFMKDNQELHQERGVDCGCGDGSCGTEKQTAGVQEPETSGCSIREEVVDGLREREGKEKQEGQGGVGRVEQDQSASGQTDGGEEPAGEDAEVLDPQVLKEEVSSLRQQVAELTQQLLRLHADFDNYRKRTRKNMEEEILRANEALVKQLLPVLDNLERALAVDSDASEASVREGVELVYRQFLDILSREGLQPIKAVGEPFDPNLHEAMMVETVEDPELENRVIGEFLKGYTFRERVLRAAMVKVGKAQQ